MQEEERLLYSGTVAGQEAVLVRSVRHADEARYITAVAHMAFYKTVKRVEIGAGEVADWQAELDIARLIPPGMWSAMVDAVSPRPLIGELRVDGESRWWKMFEWFREHRSRHDSASIHALLGAMVGARAATAAKRVVPSYDVAIACGFAAVSASLDEKY
ncbi:unnamed protein product [Closterium sp. NIES-64]|nr:unnamed protein product [Closterium sp. NIES-64]